MLLYLEVISIDWACSHVFPTSGAIFTTRGNKIPVVASPSRPYPAFVPDDFPRQRMSGRCESTLLEDALPVPDPEVGLKGPRKNGVCGLRGEVQGPEDAP